MSTTRGQHLIGQEIGPCILEKLLGYGGSSAVFLAQNRTTNEKVAVKVFLPRSTMDRQAQKNFYKRFLLEAEAASELDHPNILSIYSYGEHNGLPYIVMPYMPGGTLSEYVAKYGPLSLSLAQQYLAQISSALDYAHENGCVHCDVKPANILLDGWGHGVLSDFGIVRLMQPDNEITEQSVKSPEILMGTPEYISPEQALGEPLDGRSDVYSLAVTLFFLLAGSPPFIAEASIAIALMHVHDTPPTLGTMRADITPQIDQVIAKALAKWPEDRYQTAGEFSAAFAEAVVNAENYVFSDSEAKRRAIHFSSGGKQALAALKPVVQGKPIWRRIALPLILLLALIIGSLLSVNIIGLFTHTHTPPHVPVTPSRSQTDLLADTSEWPTGGAFSFLHGQYHIKNTSAQSIATAFYGFGSYQFANFRLTVTTSEVHGSFNSADYYGIIFRSSTDQNSYYLFEIETCCSGQYEFWHYNGPSKKKPEWDPLEEGPLNGILTPSSSNLSQTNVITVVANRNAFNFFVNNKPVGKPDIGVTGNALISGGIGLIVEEQNTEVAFSHLYITKL